MPSHTPNQEYLQQCAAAMLIRYGRQIQVRITKAAESSLYPDCAWFDHRVGEIFEPAGVDLRPMPKRYVMANGDTIPFACAEMIEPGMIRLGNYYIEFKLEKPYFVRPKAGEKMWRLSLGLLSITRMK